MVVPLEPGLSCDCSVTSSTAYVAWVRVHVFFCCCGVVCLCAHECVSQVSLVVFPARQEQVTLVEAWLAMCKGVTMHASGGSFSHRPA